MATKSRIYINYIKFDFKIKGKCGKNDGGSCDINCSMIGAKEVFDSVFDIVAFRKISNRLTKILDPTRLWKVLI